MPGEAEDGQIRAQRQHLFQAEGIGRTLADTRHAGQFGKGLLVLPRAARINQRQIGRHTHQTLQQVLAFENGQHRQQTAFTQHDALDALGHLDLTPGQIAQHLRLYRGQQRQPQQYRNDCSPHQIRHARPRRSSRPGS